MGYLVGVDTGGTFTDCVIVEEDGMLTIGKASSTPEISRSEYSIA